jgi:hypothetical protein
MRRSLLWSSWCGYNLSWAESSKCTIAFFKSFIVLIIVFPF